MKVCHLTSVHSWNDTRIFYKQCRTLVEVGHEVHLIAPNGGEREEEGVFVHGLNVKANHRLVRMVLSPILIYQKAKERHADVYHFHDPELLLLGLILKWSGKKVIYDVHEDVPRQILYKRWLPQSLRRFISFIYEQFEHFASKQLTAVVAATPKIAERFERIGCRVVVIKNYPILSHFKMSNVNWDEKEKVVCYIGSITKERGIYEIVDAIEKTNGVRLLLAGKFAYEEDYERVKNMNGWTKVDYLGYLSQDDVKKVIERARCGLVLLHPTSTYIDSLPVKMFEYMNGGIPVIASNFPLWKQIIEQNECGICVNPFDTEEIKKAIEKLVYNEDISREMGEKGKETVQEKYNWTCEGKKLIDLYESLDEEFWK